jgi:hypothetical protein
MWASRPEDLVCDGVVSPHVLDPRVGPALDVVLHWDNLLGSAVARSVIHTAPPPSGAHARHGVLVADWPAP